MAWISVAEKTWMILDPWIWAGGDASVYLLSFRRWKSRLQLTLSTTHWKILSDFKVDGLN